MNLFRLNFGTVSDVMMVTVGSRQKAVITLWIENNKLYLTKTTAGSIAYVVATIRDIES